MITTYHQVTNKRSDWSPWHCSMLIWWIFALEYVRRNIFKSQLTSKTFSLSYKRSQVPEKVINWAESDRKYQSGCSCWRISKCTVATMSCRFMRRTSALLSAVERGTCCGADVFLLINWIRSKKEREKNLNPSHQIVCFSFQLPCQLTWNLAIEATGIVVQAAVCGYLLSSTFARKSPCNVWWGLEAGFCSEWCRFLQQWGYEMLINDCESNWMLWRHDKMTAINLRSNWKFSLKPMSKPHKLL